MMELGELLSKSLLTCTMVSRNTVLTLSFDKPEEARECADLLIAICDQWYEAHIQNLRPK